MNRNLIIGIFVVVLVIVGFLMSRPEITPTPEPVNVISVSRPLPAGYVLMPEDLALSIQASPPKSALIAPSNAVGHILQRDVEAGEVLSVGDVRPVLSERGWFTNRAVVRLSVRAGEDSFCVGCLHNLWIGRMERGRTAGDFRLVTDDAIVIAIQTEDALDIADPEEPQNGFALVGRGDVVGSVLVALRPEDEYRVLEAMEKSGYTTRLSRSAEVSWLPPTATPVPSATPVATYTPLPTYTPYPTEVPKTPTPFPTPALHGGKALAVCEACRISFHDYQRANINAPDWLKRWVEENPDQYLAGVGRVRTESGDTLFDKVSYGQWITVCESGTINTLQDPQETTLEELEATGRCHSARIVDTGGTNLYINISDEMFRVYRQLSVGVWSGDVYLFGPKAK